jgi:hypothetical protein
MAEEEIAPNSEQSDGRSLRVNQADTLSLLSKSNSITVDSDNVFLASTTEKGSAYNQNAIGLLSGSKNNTVSSKDNKQPSVRLEANEVSSLRQSNFVSEVGSISTHPRSSVHEETSSTIGLYAASVRSTLPRQPHFSPTFSHTTTTTFENEALDVDSTKGIYSPPSLYADRVTSRSLLESEYGNQLSSSISAEYTLDRRELESPIFTADRDSSFDRGHSHGHSHGRSRDDDEDEEAENEYDDQYSSIDNTRYGDETQDADSEADRVSLIVLGARNNRSHFFDDDLPINDTSSIHANPASLISLGSLAPSQYSSKFQQPFRHPTLHINQTYSHAQQHTVTTTTTASPSQRPTRPASLLSIQQPQSTSRAAVVNFENAGSSLARGSISTTTASPVVAFSGAGSGGGAAGNNATTTPTAGSASAANTPAVVVANLSVYSRYGRTDYTPSLSSVRGSTCFITLVSLNILLIYVFFHISVTDFT